MHEVEDAWMEQLKTEAARDVAEEILDLILFGIESLEDREEANRLMEELEEMGEDQAVQILSEMIEK